MWRLRSYSSNGDARDSPVPEISKDEESDRRCRGGIRGTSSRGADGGRAGQGSWPCSPALKIGLRSSLGAVSFPRAEKRIRAPTRKPASKPFRARVL